MKPRWHFVLKSLSLLFGVAVALLLAVYIISFILFFLRQSGVGFMPLYGFRGVSLFVMNSPWLLIALAGALIGVLQVLVKKHSFSFKRPLLYSLTGIVLLVLFSSYVLERTQFHPRLQGLAAERSVPLFGSLYQGIDERLENITVGTIIEVTENGFILNSEANERLKIFVSAQTKQRANGTYLVSRTVLVFGNRTGTSSVDAFGIRPAPENFKHKEFKSKGHQGALLDQERPAGPLVR